jgi:hypothetical protein
MVGSGMMSLPESNSLGHQYIGYGRIDIADKIACVA